MHKSRKK